MSVFKQGIQLAPIFKYCLWQVNISWQVGFLIDESRGMTLPGVVSSYLKAVVSYIAFMPPQKG